MNAIVSLESFESRQHIIFFIYSSQLYWASMQLKHNYIGTAEMQFEVWDFSYPADSTASVFSVVGPQDLKVDVGVGAVIIKLQQAGETAHSSLKKYSIH